MNEWVIEWALHPTWMKPARMIIIIILNHGKRVWNRKRVCEIEERPRHKIIMLRIANEIQSKRITLNSTIEQIGLKLTSSPEIWKRQMKENRRRIHMKGTKSLNVNEWCNENYDNHVETFQCAYNINVSAQQLYIHEHG